MKLQDFLNLEEVSDISGSVIHIENDGINETGISFIDVCAHWNEDIKSSQEDTSKEKKDDLAPAKRVSGDTLRNITFEVNAPQLCGIIGGVGSGKVTSLNMYST